MESQMPGGLGGGLAVRRVPLADLHHDPANVRKHDDRNLSAIEASLKTFGQVEPLVVQAGTGKVIGGNGRLEVLRRSGATEADVVELDIDDTKAAALGIALNRSAALAEWDEQGLTRILESLPQDLKGVTGFTEADIDTMLAAQGSFAVGDAEAPELATGDRDPIQQMTFTLHDEQAESVKSAIRAAINAGPFVDTGNENSNGNALARIAEEYLGRC